jgi:hypothetical protein
MEAPAHTARRLLFGLGLALLLATAFALIDGRLPPSVCAENAIECTAGNDISWLVPAFTAVTLLAGFIIHLGITRGVKSPLLHLFPIEGTSAQRERMINELSDSQDEDDLSGAWANLEQGLLSSKIEEEE